MKRTAILWTAFVLASCAQGVDDGAPGDEIADDQDASRRPAEIREGQLAISTGQTLHYYEAGHGDLVLFLHGFPEHAGMWDAQLAEIGKTHHAVAIDMRGYGLSSKPDGVDQYQLPLLVADVFATADALAGPGKKFNLVAHDWGAVIAWSAAFTDPARLESLTIINVPHPVMFARTWHGATGQREASDSYIAPIKAGTAPFTEEALSANDFAFMKSWIFESGGLKLRAAEQARLVDAWRQPGALTAMLNYYRALAYPPSPVLAQSSRSELEALGVNLGIGAELPVLVLWGEQDVALVKENLDGLDEFVDNLRIRRFPNASHWVPHDEPRAVNAELKRLLRCAN